MLVCTNKISQKKILYKPKTCLTLLCLVKGNTLANTCSIHINENNLVGDLKEAIKEKIVQTFANVNTKDLKLWKVKIPDDRNDFLSNLSLQEKDELLATKKISKYFPNSPPEDGRTARINRHFESTREQELLDRIASLETSLNKSVYDMYKVVKIDSN